MALSAQAAAGVAGVAGHKSDQGEAMDITINFANMSALLSLGAGIAILLVPRLLNYIVAGYLIVVGILGLIS